MAWFFFVNRLSLHTFFQTFAPLCCWFILPMWLPEVACWWIAALKLNYVSPLWKGPHYFNSLTPDQNNKDFSFFHRCCATCRMVCSDVCERTRIQCWAHESLRVDCLLAVTVPPSHLMFVCLLFSSAQTLVFPQQSVYCMWNYEMECQDLFIALERMSAMGQFLFTLLWLSNVQHFFST